MESMHLLLEDLSYIVTLLGVPLAIFIYVKEQRLLRDEREYGTYDALDEKYIEIQQLCLEYAELDVFDTPYESPPVLSEIQKKQEEAILLIRISLFERAFLMYQRAPSKVIKDQWSGWDVEIKEWLERDNFKSVWSDHGEYFDQAFIKYMEKL